MGGNFAVKMYLVNMNIYATSVRIRSFFGLHLSAFGLNMEIYRVKMRNFSVQYPTKHFRIFLIMYIAESKCHHLIDTTKKSFLLGQLWTENRSIPPEVFLRKGVQKICSKFTGEHPCRSANSIKFLCNIIEIALHHGCSPVNVLHIFTTPFSKNTSEGLLLWKLYLWLMVRLSVCLIPRYHRQNTINPFCA